MFSRQKELFSQESLHDRNLSSWVGIADFDNGWQLGFRFIPWINLLPVFTEYPLEYLFLLRVFTDPPSFLVSVLCCLGSFILHTLFTGFLLPVSSCVQTTNLRYD